VAGLKRPISQAGPDVKKISKQLESALGKGDNLRVVQKAAAKAKQIHMAELGKATSTFRLKNVGKNGARLGVMYRSRRKGYAMAEGLVTATGKAFPIIENDTRKHSIGEGRFSVKGGFSQPSGQVLTVFGKYAGFYSRVNHPGTKGKKPWKKGYTRARPHIKKVMRRETFTIVKDNYQL